MVASSLPVAQGNDPTVGASATLLLCLGCIVGVVVPFPLDCDTGQTLVMLTLRRSIEPCTGLRKPCLLRRHWTHCLGAACLRPTLHTYLCSLQALSVIDRMEGLISWRKETLKELVTITGR